MTLTTGELHARAKALGLKGAGATEPIARAAFSASAEALGETGDRSAWDELGFVHRRAWRSAVLAALEAFPEPDRAQPTLKFGNGQPVGGLKPGDVVSVRGVVKSLYVHGPQVEFRHAQGGTQAVTLDPEHVTFTERPAPPEPTWAPGDLAEDDAGEAYVYRRGYNDTRSWWRVRDGVRCARGDEPGDDRIPGPLHKLTVTREDAP